ncbi:hypothetical protein Pcinc_010690 [Petrolisthes cinctipes]|uniref:Uncharacterized protein n=1 Tax=Petrolisthes cinctipes TaxID=88211 RepID=A0AAE1G4B7_PETCI|nr:hypothetical protein Pcinc_010690 [Petrolisthes cinctipes]
MDTDQESHPGLHHHSSFVELADLRPLPKRKPPILSSKQVYKRKVVRAKIITSTPEKENAMKKREEKLPKTKKKLLVDDESSDDQFEKISIHGESSEYEEDFDDAQTEEQARKEPEEGDYVFIRFKPAKSKNKWLFYVGLITKIFTEDGETSYDVDFYRQSKKCLGKFVKPVCEGKAGTKRVQSMLQFPVNLDQYKCQ